MQPQNMKNTYAVMAYLTCKAYLQYDLRYIRYK